MRSTLGRGADTVAGALSRLLHVRSARHNTVGDLERYYDLEAEALFPRPRPPADLHVERTLADRARGTSSLVWTSTHEVLCPRYRLRHEKEYRSNLVARARWIRPEGRLRRRCLVYVHGWLEPGPWAEELTLFRVWARELPVDIVHVALPFHGPRLPRGSLFSGEWFWTGDLVRSLEGVRQAICDVRTAIAWLREQGYEEVGVTGLSLGGALVMVLACVDPLPDFVIPVMAHLSLGAAVEQAPILWRMRHDLERWGLDERARREVFQRIGLEHISPKLAPERQLWVQAKDDLYIDAGLVEQQWRAWHEPPILWIEGGHMTFPLELERITSRMREFLS